MTDRLAASMRSWWEESGVDCLVQEEPRNWLAPEPGRPSPAAPGPQPAQALRESPDTRPLPATLAEFGEFLAGSPLFGPLSVPRVGPSGDPAAGLMVMIDMPSRGDLAEGRLLTGEAGELFDRMMGAIGRDRQSLYLASLTPVRSPSGRLTRSALSELRTPAVHHVGLVAPRALLLFGDTCANALLGAPVIPSRGRWHELAGPAGPIRAIATLGPRSLLEKPGLKKLAWKDLQILMEGLKG